MWHFLSGVNVPCVSLNFISLHCSHNVPLLIVDWVGRPATFVSEGVNTVRKTC